MSGVGINGRGVFAFGFSDFEFTGQAPAEFPHRRGS